MHDAATANMPAFPAIALRVLELLSDEDVRVEQLAEEIDSDPLFSAQILRVANSPIFGFRSQIDTVQFAIVALGLSRIQAITMSVATANYMRTEFKTKELHRCWCHTVASAVICRSLARVCSLPADRAYTAGLLHDIGRLGLLVAYPREYAAMLRGAGQKPQALLEREVELFGTDHCEAGRFLVEQWGLPADFALVTGHHHEKPSGKSLDWQTVSYLACQMADSMGFSVVKPCKALAFESLCKLLPAPIRHRFQAQSEVLKATIDLAIDAHDFTVSNPPEPAVKGVDLEASLPDAVSAPTTDSMESEPPMVISGPSNRSAWGQIGIAATLVLLVVTFIALFLLVRHFQPELPVTIGMR